MLQPLRFRWPAVPFQGDAGVIRTTLFILVLQLGRTRIESAHFLVARLLPKV
jgi:hypothetical protein